MGRRKYNHEVGNIYFSVKERRGNIKDLQITYVLELPDEITQKYKIATWKVTINKNDNQWVQVYTQNCTRLTLNKYAQYNADDLDQLVQAHRLPHLLSSGGSLEDHLCSKLSRTKWKEAYDRWIRRYRSYKHLSFEDIFGKLFAWQDKQEELNSLIEE